MTDPTASPLSWPPGWRRTVDGHVEVKLQRWAGVALLDVGDAVHLCQLNWYAHRQRLNVYARTDVWMYGKKRTYTMHRLVMGARAGQQVDHRDGNGLDNRRDNLRMATTMQNAANRTVRGGKYSSFKGVTIDKRKSRGWIAQIGQNYRHINIGTFDDELVAAAAYDIYATALHGEFARTNLGVLLGIVHPDSGGSNEAMSRVNVARDAMLAARP